MLYRENGQFKTSYRADQQIFPIAQDRIAILVLLALAFVAVPLLASDYLLNALMLPFLILAIAAIGLNILVGYCGQISLGTAAFMGVGAYAAYNLELRLPGLGFFRDDIFLVTRAELKGARRIKVVVDFVADVLKRNRAAIEG